MSTASRPLVSVILATNRGGPYLAEALASVRAQTYDRIELVVVDDGSPDPEQLRSITAQERMLRIPPSGVSTARNRGVDITQGELLAFLDDDDRWHPERLTRHVEQLAKLPDAVVSYCRMNTIDAEGRLIVTGDQRGARGPGDVIRGRSGIMLGNLIIRRDTFTAIGGFDPIYRQGEDLDLVLKAVRLGPFAFIDEPLMDYRRHGANTTGAHRDLATALREILRRHRAEAASDERRDLVAAYTERLRANDRFAAWSAARAVGARLSERRWQRAVAEVAWAARFAPLAPVWWARRRLLSPAAAQAVPSAEPPAVARDQ